MMNLPNIAQYGFQTEGTILDNSCLKSVVEAGAEAGGKAHDFLFSGSSLADVAGVGTNLAAKAYDFVFNGDTLADLATEAGEKAHDILFNGPSLADTVEEFINSDECQEIKNKFEEIQNKGDEILSGILEKVKEDLESSAEPIIDEGVPTPEIPENSDGGILGTIINIPDDQDVMDL